MNKYLKKLCLVIFVLCWGVLLAEAVTAPMGYEVVEKEKMMKGGQLNPLIRPKYVFYRVHAVLTEDKELNEGNVKAVLDEIIARLRVQDKPDAISIFLHETKEHYEGASIPFARVDWWPKGHDLSPENKTNIKNKNTYLTEYDISLPNKIDDSKVVKRLTEKKRREIYTALVKSQDKANAEAEAKFPTDPSKIPFSQLKTYDFKTAFEKNSEMSEGLKKKYRNRLRKKYKIAEEELGKIDTEGFEENWPLPKL